MYRIKYFVEFIPNCSQISTKPITAKSIITQVNYKNQTYVRFFIIKILTMNIRSIYNNVVTNACSEWGVVMKSVKRRFVLKSKMRFSIFISSMIVLGSIVVFTGNAYGYKHTPTRTITVCEGDTLWSIASKYRTKDDIRKYIFLMKKANNLPDSTIYAGTQLILPD